MAELTPMKRQYQEIKEQHRDCLLFFRLGDFYEMFNDDAVTASRELDLALTTRDRNVEDPEERTPMCGVPYHSAEGYIAKLISKGYKVAICEQLEDPALAKGLVQRDVIRIITPGTVTDSSMLSEDRSNYICATPASPSASSLPVSSAVPPSRGTGRSMSATSSPASFRGKRCSPPARRKTAPLYGGKQRHCILPAGSAGRHARAGAGVF